MEWKVSVKDLRKLAFVALVAPLQLLVGVLALPPAQAHSAASCADVIAAQLANGKAVHGSFHCIGGELLAAAQNRGVASDAELASAFPAFSQGSYEYVGRASNGDLLYEVKVDGGVVAYGLATDTSGKVVAIH